MSVTFHQEKLSAVKAEAEPLLRRHWEEIAMDRDVVPLDPNWALYGQLEADGMLSITTARDPRIEVRGKDGALIGYVCYIVAPALHYQSLVVADCDIFWLAPEYRGRMLGARLIAESEKPLPAMGANKVVNKVKLTHDAGSMFERLGYKAIERVYTKLLV